MTFARDLGRIMSDLKGMVWCDRLACWGFMLAERLPMRLPRKGLGGSQGTTAQIETTGCGRTQRIDHWPQSFNCLTTSNEMNLTVLNCIGLRILPLLLCCVADKIQSQLHCSTPDLEVQMPPPNQRPLSTAGTTNSPTHHTVGPAGLSHRPRQARRVPSIGRPSSRRADPEAVRPAFRPPGST